MARTLQHDANRKRTMGKFIVLEVDDNEIADALLEKLNAKPLLWRVVGIFERPRGHCPHTLREGGYDAAKRVARGSKYGWWVHNVTGCMRPRRGSHQLQNLIGVEAYPRVEGRMYTQMISTLHIFDVPTGNMARGDVDPA